MFGRRVRGVQAKQLITRPPVGQVLSVVVLFTQFFFQGAGSAMAVSIDAQFTVYTFESSFM